VIHDWVVLIMWVTSLGVTAWGQRWKAKADRLADAVEYLVEEQMDADTEEAVQEDADPSDRV
jgi:hypothetical protein